MRSDAGAGAALSIYSVQAVVPGSRLRPYLIDAVQRGVQRTPGPLAAGAA